MKALAAARNLQRILETELGYTKSESRSHILLSIRKRM